jgi:basic membrane lipoprotein Med (substrate-binding protein (PBP1-ABC) superfamily)
MKKILLTLMATASMAASALAADVKPALIYDLGGKFDKSFNEAAFNGAEKFKADTGIEYREFESPTTPSANRRCASSPSDGQNPIVVVGFSWAAALEKVAPEYPDTKFTIIDMVVTGSPTSSRSCSRNRKAPTSSASWRPWLQVRQGRLRRRHGHSADPQIRLRLCRRRQVCQRRMPKYSRT